MKTHLKLSFPLLLLTSILAGCSSTPQVASSADQHQYCYTDEIIEMEDRTQVKSRTKVQCTDKPRVEHVVKDAGIASDCRISRPLNSNRSNPKYGETLLCRFTDPMGKTVWRPVNEAFAYPNFN